MSTTDSTTDSTETTEDATQAPGDQEEVQAPPDAEQAPETPPDDDQDDERAGAEAARYRRRLRETEADRDALAARVETYQRAAVEQAAAEVLTVPRSIWAAGVEIADLLDDDGVVDRAKVVAAAKAAAADLGLAKARPSNYVRGEGNNPRSTPGRSMLDVVMGSTE